MLCTPAACGISPRIIPTFAGVSPTDPGNATVFHPRGGRVKAGLFYVPTGPIPTCTERFYRAAKTTAEGSKNCGPAGPGVRIYRSEFDSIKASISSAGSLGPPPSAQSFLQCFTHALYRGKRASLAAAGLDAESVVTKRNPSTSSRSATPNRFCIDASSMKVMLTRLPWVSHRMQ